MGRIRVQSTVGDTKGEKRQVARKPTKLHRPQPRKGTRSGLRPRPGAAEIASAFQRPTESPVAPSTTVNKESPRGKEKAKRKEKRVTTTSPVALSDGGGLAPGAVGPPKVQQKRRFRPGTVPLR